MWNKLFKSKSKSKIQSNILQPDHQDSCSSDHEINETTTQLCGIVKTKSKSKFSKFKTLTLRRNTSRKHNASLNANDSFNFNNECDNAYLDTSVVNFTKVLFKDHQNIFNYNTNTQNLENEQKKKCDDLYIDSIKLSPPKLQIPDEPPPNLELQKCPICSRTFVPTTLAKHITICERVQTKKRKQFDSSRQRREGTELASYLPKNFGLPHKPESLILMRVSPPKTNIPSATTTPLAMKKLSNAKSPAEQSKETPKPIKRVPCQLQNEPCPYCERCFGIKAYDRHVEWCREKALLNKNHTKGDTTTIAKERLQARIQYKAPSLKSKRQMTREKYSGGSLSCGGSTNSLQDIGTFPRHRSHLNSMSSSITSDSGHSDKYDPFVSAKRQLEELFSPSTANTSTPKDKAQTPITPVLSNSTNTNIKTTPVLSNFRRTSSLRMPSSRKLSKVLLFSKPAKSNIQRGLTDDGPISPNFIKSTEYDELPIRSVFNAIPVNINHHHDKPVMRESTSATNRRNLKLDLKDCNNPVSINSTIPDNSLSKTDSLAVFLKYENELNCTPSAPSLTEKELKDKSNTLSKRSAATRSGNEVKENAKKQEEKPDKALPEISLVKKLPQKITPVKLESVNLTSLNSIKPPILTLDSILNNDKRDHPDFIDPKLINLCDNLPIDNIQKISSDCSETSSTTLENMKQSSDEFEQNTRPISGRSSSTSLNGNGHNKERRPTLRRQIKLSKDNILFDTSPETPDNKVTELIIENSYNSKKSIERSDEIESIFEDFDFEEFISSFEDDEQYPIFRDYKNILLSRNILHDNNNRNNNLSRSEIHEQQISIFPGRKKNEPQILNLPNINVSGSSMTNYSDNLNNNQIERNNGYADQLDISISEKELMKTVQELDRMGQSGTYPVLDSDEFSSTEGYSRRQVGSKFSADSAYGSISRQSPPEHQSIRRCQQRKDNELNDNSKRLDPNRHCPQLHRNRDNLSLSSSGSESSLPPISNTLKTQKMELHGTLSKFCHECGSQFPLNSAKFCMECGVKRIFIH